MKEVLKLENGNVLKVRFTGSEDEVMIMYYDKDDNALSNTVLFEKFEKILQYRAIADALEFASFQEIDEKDTPMDHVKPFEVVSRELLIK